MNGIGAIENTYGLTYNFSNNVIHMPEEKFYLWSILLIVFSAAATFKILDYLAYCCLYIIGYFPHFRWYPFRQLSHSTSLDVYVTFLLQHGHKQFLSCTGFISVSDGISCFKSNSYSFSHRFWELSSGKHPLLKHQLAHTMNHHN